MRYQVFLCLLSTCLGPFVRYFYCSLSCLHLHREAQLISFVGRLISFKHRSIPELVYFVDVVTNGTNPGPLRSMK